MSRNREWPFAHERTARMILTSPCMPVIAAGEPVEWWLICETCGGEGRCWGHELRHQYYEPGRDAYTKADMTRYTCDWCDGRGLIQVAPEEL